jgi:replicative DNA helicase
VVDYLQLMRSGERAENRVREVAQIAHGLKNLSKEIKVPVLALCQLNRASEATRGKGRPSMHDLRESGDLEQDADVVILLHRANRQGVASTQQSDAVGEAEEEQPENNPECELEIIVDKQRNGPTGIVTMRFMRQFGRFYEIDRYSAKNISS